MKGLSPFLFGCIILLLAARALATVNLEASTPQVPEPGVLLLLGAGLIGVLMWAIIKKKKTGTKGKNNP